MAKKLTKRKAFNFLRSYFDVLNELENDSDKLEFLTAIINKQFLDEDPIGLNFLVNLCYESQRHHIETSVKGYKFSKKTDLLGNPIGVPLEGGAKGVLLAPPVQEEEKEEEKEKEIIDWELLLKLYNDKFGRKTRVVPTKTKRQIKERLKEGYSKQDFLQVMDNARGDQYHIDNKYKYLTLEFLTRSDKFERYVQNHNYKIKFKTI